MATGPVASILKKANAIELFSYNEGFRFHVGELDGNTLRVPTVDRREARFALGESVMAQRGVIENSERQL